MLRGAGNFWDVTLQKRTEMALAHERDLLRTLLDAFRTGYISKTVTAGF